jgi:hypothetical protein
MILDMIEQQERLQYLQVAEILRFSWWALVGGACLVLSHSLIIGVTASSNFCHMCLIQGLNLLRVA